jgi:hypothetical protein
MSVFHVVTTCGLVDRHRRFGGKYCLRLQGQKLYICKYTSRYCPEEHRYFHRGENLKYEAK